VRLLDNLLLPEPAGEAGEAARLSRPDTVGEAEPTEPPLET